MSIRSPRRPGFRPLVRRWSSDARGATAVEFGLVCVPFIALLGAIVQLAFTAWAQENLDYTFQEAARTVLTGQFQAGNDQKADGATLLAALHNAMCGASSPNPVTVYSCPGVKLDVRVSGGGFAGVTTAAIVDPSTRTWAPNFGKTYTCAPPNAIVIATAALDFPVFFGLWNAGLSTFSDGGTLIQSTAVFRTEPYASQGAQPC